MASMTPLPPPSQAGAGAGGGGTTSTGVGGAVGSGGGGGGAVVVVVVLVVVEVVVLVVLDVVVEVEALRAADVVAVDSPLPPSSRPWNTRADAETTAIARTIRPPITHPRVPNLPTLCNSAPRPGPLSPGHPAL
jgi:hypothetical protein